MTTHVTPERMQALFGEVLDLCAVKRGEKVAVATVYNTLKAFSDAGLLREITVNGTRSTPW